jgi:prophage regulatory protein
MNISKRYQIIRKDEVLNSLGLSKSTLHNRIADGLMTPSISLGGRAVGFLKFEVETVLAAYVQGNTNEEIKKLILMLVKSRQISDHLQKLPNVKNHTEQNKLSEAVI